MLTTMHWDHHSGPCLEIYVFGYIFMIAFGRPDK
jgi:hypothetical protein